jgi:hypothetical protein
MSAAILTLPTRQTMDAKALEFAPQILAIQDKPPSPLPRAMLYSLMLLFALLFAWALIGKLDIVATAEGRLAVVRLDAQKLTAQEERFELAPGMQVIAEVNQGKRTVMEYLLSPVQGTFQSAARER